VSLRATAHEATGAEAWAAPKPKQARSELSTRRLLDAAAELIAEVGYDRATLAAIGERAGYSHGLVTRRFRTKENLLWSLVEDMTFSWEAQVLRPAVAGLVGVDALVVIVEAIRDSVRRAPREMRSLYSLMFEALKPVPVLRDRMTELHRKFTLDLARHVQRGIEQGVVSVDADPDGAARLMVGALRGSAYLWLLDPERFDLATMLDDLRTLLDRTLRTPPAPSKEAPLEHPRGIISNPGACS